MAFLDPHELVWSTRGVKFDLSSTLSDTCQTLFAQYSDQFAGFQTDTLRIDGAPVDGTLFRLPLRSVESRAQFPEISDDDTVSDVTWTTGARRSPWPRTDFYIWQVISNNCLLNLDKRRT